LRCTPRNSQNSPGRRSLSVPLGKAFGVRQLEKGSILNRALVTIFLASLSVSGKGCAAEGFFCAGLNERDRRILVRRVCQKGYRRVMKGLARRILSLAARSNGRLRSSVFVGAGFLMSVIIIRKTRFPRRAGGWRTRRGDTSTRDAPSFRLFRYVLGSRRRSIGWPLFIDGGMWTGSFQPYGAEDVIMRASACL
jgi:hypothetical protein